MRTWFCVLYIVVLAVSFAYADRTVWYVHPDSALNSIQAGLDSCASNDIVLVAPGTYYENIVWPNTQGIHLISELGPEVTIIDGNSTDRVIMIASGVDSTTIIREFTIQNGYRTDCGSGIYCDSSSPIITDNIIRQNHTGHYMDPTRGGGILCIASSPIIRNNIITENGATGSGAGIQCDSSSSPVITGNTITDNQCAASTLAHGGGITCLFSSSIISGNTILDNWPEGIHCESSSSAIISGNIISNNGRWGIGFLGIGSPRVMHNTVNGNGWGTSWPAGIHCCWNSSPIIDSNTISINTGAGIYCHNHADPTIHYNNITNNTEYGIFCDNRADPSIYYNNIVNNTGYGIFCSDSADPIVHYNNIFNNGYGMRNLYAVWIDADYNWWGDSTGPYNADSNQSGQGDTVSYYVHFIPWLGQPYGVWEQPIISSVTTPIPIGATIFHGPLHLPQDKSCKVFDITGREVKPHLLAPGIYFVEVDGVVTQKVIKIK